MSNQAATSYLRTKVLTATPEQLQLLLYDGAIRFAEQGRAALVKKDFEASYLALSRSQKIIAELSSSLRPSVFPELCSKLASLYNYVYRKLVEANTKHTPESLDEALSILRFQRETWAMLLDQLGKKKAAAAATKIEMPTPNSRMEASINTAA